MSRFRIPNECLVDDTEKARVAGLFRVVEAWEGFDAIKIYKWSVDRAEIMTPDAIRKAYIRGGRRRGQAWADELDNALGDGHVAVFGIAIRDRSGLEGQPDHVKGRHLTFFVDVLERDVMFVIHSVISE